MWAQGCGVGLLSTLSPGAAGLPSPAVSAPSMLPCVWCRRGLGLWAAFPSCPASTLSKVEAGSLMACAPHRDPPVV